MDYYSTLGVNKTASVDEIKKAYKKQSMQHHPDRTGGDDTKFKEINEAYQTLSDPQKRQMYDQFGTSDPRQRQYTSQDFNFGMGGFDDIFAQMFGGRGFGQQPRGNRTISVAVDISLEDVLTGKTIGMEIELLNGRTKVVTVDIPAGVQHGQQIKYGGIGDDSHRQSRPGDIIIQVRVRNHKVFERIDDNILCEAQIDVLDLMAGTKTNIRTLEGRRFDINIPAGTQPDTVLSCKGEGLPNIRTKQKGNLLVRIKGKIERKLSLQQINSIRNIINGI